ncbi:MAG: AMP-binding protein [Granulosicoccus sp.]
MNEESNFSTLTAVLQARSESTQTVTFVKGQGQHKVLSYAELYGLALNRLAEFQECGLKPGSELVIQVADNDLFLEGFWACLLGGIVAVPVSGGNSIEHRHKLFRILEKLDNPGLYIDEQTRTRLAEFATENDLTTAWSAVSDKILVANLPPQCTKEASVHHPAADDVAFIQFSSGSTSTPKGVVLTHRNLIVNTRSIVQACEMSQRDRMLSWMPLTHDMGLIGFHLTPVIHDICHFLMPTDVFVRRPGLWLTEAAEQKITLLCSPNFGYQHLLKTFKPEKYDDLDLSSIRLLFNGAEPISVELCERFMNSLVPFKLAEDAMCPVYGLAEASLAVTFSPLDNRFTVLTISRGALGVGQRIQLAQNDSDSSVAFVAVGRPVPDVEVQIREASGQQLAESTTGHICIRGENVTKGYYRELELNKEVISPDGWLNTGDLGFIHDGLLFITGRAKDIIFVNGQNVYPHDLEEIVLQAGLVERGKLAISSQWNEERAEESLLVFVLHRGESSELVDTARAITRLLGEAAGVRAHSVVPVSRIPKTTSGKIQRYLLVKALEQGEFSPILQQHDSSDFDEEPHTIVSETVEQTIAARLLNICNAEVVDMKVAADDNLFELGISSLTLAQIHAAIEESWPDQVDITDLFDYPTVSELAEFLQSKT